MFAGSPSRRAGRVLAASAVLLATLFVAPTPGIPPAGAIGDDAEYPSKVTAHVTASGDQYGDVPLPDCGPININGRGPHAANKAKWTVGASVASGTPLEVGDTVTFTATVYGFSSGSAPNDGPDPLILDLTVLGPVAQGAETTATLIEGNQYAGNGFRGPVAPYGPFGYEFDSNSSPKGLVQPGDGAHVQMKVTVEAVAPGGMNVTRLRVFGHDATPIAGDFSCEIPVGFSYPISGTDPPVSGPDSVTTDAAYAVATVDDANTGPHGITVDVLANDDDPEEPGGPGDTDEVRIKDWQPGSVKGGTVSCGTGAQKGEDTFTAMSTGPCTYTPPVGATGVDSFGYVLSSINGKDTFVKVNVTLRPNSAPVFGTPQVGAVSNTDTVFDLSAVATDVQGDPLSCIPGVVSATGTVTGSVTVDGDCDALWEPDGPGSGDATFPIRVCDTHPLLGDGAHGALGAKAPGYATGDLGATTSRRCTDGEVAIVVSSGLIAPPLGNGDSDIVDAGYAGDGVGAYSVEVPVLANDTDVNGPAPSSPQWTGVLDVVDADGVIEVDGSPAGTATVVGDLIRFTPADGFSGDVQVPYRVCEDPATQDPSYDEEDDPQTPQVEGLPFCGVGILSLFVVPNDPPDAVDDAVLTSSIAPVVDLEADANDTDPQGETITCTAGPLAATPAGLIETASIDEQCRVDATPVLGAEGVATLTYEACDVHPLSQPTSPATPYGADGRSPGDVTSRCSTAEVAVEIVAPATDDPGLFELDPPPTCVADTAIGAEDDPLPIVVLDNDTDLDFVGDPSPLTTTTAGIAGDEGQGVTTEGGTVAVTDDGRVLYEPPAGFSGTDTFLYSAQDVVGHGCSAEVTVAVAADPDDPTDPDDGDDDTDRTPGGDRPGGGSGTGPLARTGTDAGELVSIAAVLLAIGGGLVALALLRRRPTATP
ncbi:MAG TPA: Ig-like domain-containing protein [Iamia sp.]|nr:Ig-like domain-containing protein [Iamia sp.]